MNRLPNDVMLEREMRLEQAAEMLNYDPPKEKIPPENKAAIEELHAWAQKCSESNLAEAEDH